MICSLKKEQTLFGTVVYAAGSQMLCSQPRRCCFLLFFFSCSHRKTKPKTGQQTWLTTTKTPTLAWKCIFPLSSRISVSGTFFVLYHAYLFLFYYLFCYVFIALVVFFVNLMLAVFPLLLAELCLGFLRCICETLPRPQMRLQSCAAQRGREAQACRCSWRLGWRSLLRRFSLCCCCCCCSVTTSSPLLFQQPFRPPRLAELVFLFVWVVGTFSNHHTLKMETHF